METVIIIMLVFVILGLIGVVVLVVICCNYPQIDDDEIAEFPEYFNE